MQLAAIAARTLADDDFEPRPRPLASPSSIQEGAAETVESVERVDVRRSSSALRGKKPLRIVCLLGFLSLLSFLAFLVQKIIYVLEFIVENEALTTILIARVMADGESDAAAASATTDKDESASTAQARLRSLTFPRGLPLHR